MENQSSMRARVWNDHSEEHKEFFNGKWVTIPPGGSIEMDSSEAVLLKGQFYPMTKRLPDGTKRKQVKMLRLEVMRDEALAKKAAEAIKNKCHKCGETCKTPAGLANHIRLKHKRDETKLVEPEQAREKVVEYDPG